MDGDSDLDRLRIDGYLVLTAAVPAAMCQAVVDGLADVLDIRLDDAGTWSRIGTEPDMVPMWGHPSQWAIRQLPGLYDVWRRIWRRDDLWVDVNSCRVTPPWRRGRADALAVHFDVDPHDSAQ